MATITSDILTTVSSKESEKKFPPAYFLSLTVENVRCFGPEQILDLSNGKGRPAQWTIILGNNGVGKTTILQSLVALLPAKFIEDFIPRCFDRDDLWFKWRPFRVQGGNRSRLAAKFINGISLTKSAVGEEAEYDVEGTSTGGWNRARGLRSEEIGNINCFGYGASRRMGDTSLSEKAEDDPFASLFSDDAPLLNAEEWLLQADYAAYAADNILAKKRAKERRDTIKEILIKLLPDVEGIKFVQLTEKQLRPGIEVKTPVVVQTRERG